MTPIEGAAWSLGAMLAAATFWWIVSLQTKDCGVADRWWGMGMLLGAFVAWQAMDIRGPRFYLFALMALWAIRLSAHLYGRSQGAPEDPRYAAMRQTHGKRWPLLSLVQVFWLQALAGWVISVPVLFVLLAPAGPAFNALDGAGIAVFAIGLVVEGTADAQLQVWRNRGGKGLFTGGLWQYSQHPNYFGELLVWIGLWICAAAHGGWWTLIGPGLLAFFLLRVSGVPMMRKHLADRDGAAAYRKRTSPFVPMPPRGR